MNQYAELDFRKDATAVSGIRDEHLTKIIRALRMTAIVAAAVLGLIVISRLTPEQPLELFTPPYFGP